MEKKRSSLLSSLFPWLSPFVIKFVIVKGGIEIQLFRNDRQITRWRASKLQRNLPEPLLKWIEENHLTEGPQPYPLVKQLWHNLIPLVSKKLLFDASELAALQETSQPPTFAMTWKLKYELACIEGSYSGADNYLGMGWFQKETQVWPLKQQFPQVVTSYFENLTAPLERASTLLNTVIPALQPYFAARADFQLIANFAVNIVVQDARSERLTLALESNYPQLLSTLSIPQQQTDFLLAQQSLISFPRQALTPVLMHLLQGKGTPVSLQGENIPLFIAAQLPTMRHYYQISEEAAQQIAQAYPLVSIVTLQASFAFPIRTVENGIGQYSAAATYQYQNHILNMLPLLDAYKRKQRFVNQQGIWFEWPKDSYYLAQSIRQSLVPHVLQPAEVMGLTEGQRDISQSQPIAYTIQPEGTTPSARAQTLFKQLQYYGIPGGIFGEPPGLVSMLLGACENLVHDNRQARILWLTTSHRKGGVTRAIDASSIQRHVKVASLVTLRDEPNLLELSWTLVVFHALDRSQDNNPLRRTLPQLKWQWALLTVTSQTFFDPFLMQTLHLPEQYSRQFSERYLFDPTRSYQKSVSPGSRPVSPVPAIAHPPEVKPAPVAHPAVKLTPAAPPVQVNKAETPRPPAPTSSRFSTHEITSTSKTTPLPPSPLRMIPSPAFSFWEQAQRWVNLLHEAVPLEKFDHVAPTYLTMQKTGVLEYYFYWRSEVRNNRYPATDTGYILVHVYEAIARIGFATSASALNRLIDLWAHYRDSFPILDQWLVPWIADFCVVYHVPYRPMDWYTRLLTIPNYCGEVLLLAEAWSRQGGDWAKMPSAVLHALIQWQPALPLSPVNLSQHTLPERYHQALTGIDRYLREQEGIHGIIVRYEQGQPVTMARVPFSGALVERRHAPIAIEKVNSTFTSIEFRQTIIAILRYADYVSQQVKPVVPPAHLGIGIDRYWQKAIEATLAGKQPDQISQSMNRVVMNQVATKAVPAPVVNQTPAPVQIPPDNARTNPVAPTGHPIIELNPTKIAQLREESEHLQERLTVEETAPSLLAMQVPSLLPVRPAPTARQEQQAVAQQLEAIETVRKEPVAASRANSPDTTNSMAIPLAQPVQSQANAKVSTEMEKASASLAKAALLPMRQQLPAQTNLEKNEQERKAEKQEIFNRIANPGVNPAVQLNQGTISKLREESEYLQERLTVEQEGVSEESEGRAEPVTGEATDTILELAEAVHLTGATDQVSPEVDEDWQVIYPQWNVEHWEILHLLCQEQTIQFTVEKLKSRRPISMLIDEINLPVDEQLNDLLIDAETQTLFPHLRATVEHLVRWYYSLESR